MLRLRGSAFFVSDIILNVLLLVPDVYKIENLKNLKFVLERFEGWIVSTYTWDEL